MNKKMKARTSKKYFSCLVVLMACICLLLSACGQSAAADTSYDEIDLTGVEVKTELEQISEHVWRQPQYVDTDRPNLFLIVGDDSSVMIDAGASTDQAKEFYSEVIRLGLPEPEAVLLTHWHWDHSFGSDAIPAKIYAHPITQATLDILSTWDWSDDAVEERVQYGFENPYVQMTMDLELPDRSDLKIRVPDETLSDGQVFDLGNVSVRADFLLCDHSEDCVGYYIAEDDLLLIGDVMYEDYYHGPDHFSETKLSCIIDQIESHPANSFYGSHTDGAMTREDLLNFFNSILETEYWEYDGEGWETYVMRGLGAEIETE